MFMIYAGMNHAAIEKEWSALEGSAMTVYWICQDPVNMVETDVQHRLWMDD